MILIFVFRMHNQTNLPAPIPPILAPLAREPNYGVLEARTSRVVVILSYTAVRARDSYIIYLSDRGQGLRGGVPCSQETVFHLVKPVLFHPPGPPRSRR